MPCVTSAAWTFNLGLAAILGKNVYNFGELLAHPILNALRGTTRNWVVELLLAFNAGNIDNFGPTISDNHIVTSAFFRSIIGLQ